MSLPAYLLGVLVDLIVVGVLAHGLIRPTYTPRHRKAPR